MNRMLGSHNHPPPPPLSMMRDPAPGADPSDSADMYAMAPRLSKNSLPPHAQSVQLHYGGGSSKPKDAYDAAPQVDSYYSRYEPCIPPLSLSPSTVSRDNDSRSTQDEPHEGALGKRKDSEGHDGARKRSRHAWPVEMTRQIINVLLDEFLVDPAFRTTIYRSREERDHRFIASGRSTLEEYNKVQNIRRRYFIPLSYLLQWDQLRAGARTRQRVAIEKKLAKPLERSRLHMIFRSCFGATEEDKPMFELDIFVSELKRRDAQLWDRGVGAFHAWTSRKCSIEYIINH